MMLAFAGITLAQVSNNASLSGQYYFRQVLLITDSSGTNVVDTRSGWGTLNFDGNGAFTINGQQLVGTAAPAALTGSGTYAVKAGGFTTLSNPLRAGSTVNARLGVGALVGSSTEAGPTVFDLFLAIPTTSLGSLNGPYWVSSLEFPNGGTANIRNTNFKLTADGSPFAGPVYDQSGKVIFAAGVVPTYAQIEATDVFVKGVVGDLPKS